MRMENELPRGARRTITVNKVVAWAWAVIAVVLTGMVVGPMFSSGALVRAVIYGLLALALYSPPVWIVLALNRVLSRLKPSARRWQIGWSIFLLLCFPLWTIPGFISLNCMLFDKETREAFGK